MGARRESGAGETDKCINATGCPRVHKMALDRFPAACIAIVLEYISAKCIRGPRSQQSDNGCDWWVADWSFGRDVDDLCYRLAVTQPCAACPFVAAGLDSLNFFSVWVPANALDSPLARLVVPTVLTFFFLFDVHVDCEHL